MSRIGLFAAAILLVPQFAAAHVVRHSSIPQPFWGTWGTDATQCAGAKETIVLSGKTYMKGAAQCTVENVSETPGPKGSIYSARLQCSDNSATPAKNSSANLIFRPTGDDRISLGADFRSLVDYRRCSANEADKR